MKVTYRFVNEIVEAEVADEWGDMLVELDRQEYNNNQRETRRHVSLNMVVEEQGNQFGYNTDFESRIITQDALARMWSALLPQQRELLQKVHIEGRSIASIARDEGVNEAAIRNRLKKAYVRAKKNFR